MKHSLVNLTLIFTGLMSIHYSYSSTFEIRGGPSLIKTQDLNINSENSEILTHLSAGREFELKEQSFLIEFEVNFIPEPLYTLPYLDPDYVAPAYYESESQYIDGEHLFKINALHKKRIN